MHNERSPQKTSKPESQVLGYILTEYYKHIDIDQLIVDRSDNYLERYITIITGAVGIIIALGELFKPQGLAWHVSGAIIGMPLIFGFATFSRLVSYDIYLRNNQKRRNEIRRELIIDYPELEKYFPAPGTMFNAAFRDWASIPSIIMRAISYGGSKTILAIGNSIVLAIESFLIFQYGMQSPLGRVSSIVFALLIFFISGALHVTYARIRYRLNEKFFYKL